MNATDVNPAATPDVTSGRQAVAATGILAAFTHAGILEAPDVHVASTLAWLGSEHDDRVILAAALTVRALRAGSVCLPLVQARELAERLDRAPGAATLDDLPWPDQTAWEDAVAASPLAADGSAPSDARPLRLVDGHLYLARDWSDEGVVCRVLLERLSAPPPVVDEPHLVSVIARVLGTASTPEARAALMTAARSWTTVLAGGPGTGKTTLIGALLRVLADRSDTRGEGAPPLRAALAAPTGKAAARLAGVVGAQTSPDPDDPGATAPRLPGAEVATGTLHRLLGSRGPGRGFRYGPDNPLPYEVVVVDEMSMVSLAMMAALLAALGPTTRLVLVGDPDQLASVEAGAVLADLVDAALPRTRGSVEGATIRLHHSWRFAGPIADLAQAIRDGDPDRAIEVLTSGHDGVEFVEASATAAEVLRACPELRRDITTQAQRIDAAIRRHAAADALAALDGHRLLCAHREGPFGAGPWGRAVEQAARAGEAAQPGGHWYPGRAVLMTVNQPGWGTSNGDQGVVFDSATGPVVVTGDPDRILRVPLAALDGVQPLYATTVHKSQGSQFDQVTLVLPPADSPLLTRELLYTAVTRARFGVRVIGTLDAVRQAVGTPAWRASGLAHRLRGTG
ncbi:MAG: exodeoxyribonuclease V subunit alpha [Actinomycetia bacterium]|nr:exodeoxyribonuclease V subunit alpha [Actinomycetes bacterium]